MITAALVLAAGQSRRFGVRDKLTAPLDGRPLLAHVLAALALPELPLRLAVVSSDAVERIAGDAGFGTLRIAPGLPMADSLRSGLAVLRARGAGRLLVALGDMPWIGGADIRALLDFPPAEAACAACAEVPMPPAVFPAAMFDMLASLAGDRGAGALLRDIPAARRLALPAARLRDVDRPDDLHGGASAGASAG